MEDRIENVLAEYETRQAKESEIIQRFWKKGGPVPPLDEMLLPIGRDVGTLLNHLIKAHHFKDILEVGTSYGNSTIWFAEAARETGGKVISLEMAPNKVEVALTMLERAGLSPYVEFIVGDAVETIKSLPGPFDFVLIDLWKDLYIPTLEAIYPKLSAGAIIAADNMLFPEIHAADAAKYRQAVRGKPNIDSLLLNMGEGIELSRFSTKV